MEQPKVTQAMIDAYDEYTHLTLDRRSFIQKLQLLAGSAAAAAAIMPMIAANSAQASITEENDSRLQSTSVTFPGAAGDVKGYLATPQNISIPLPAVIVIHENRGLNAHIRDIARRVALEGFVALAPDFLSPSGGTPEDEDKAREMIAALDGKQTIANAVAAVDYARKLKFSTGKAGCIGFCWGGGLANQLAVHSPDLKAAIAYYGAQPTADDVPKIKASLLLHYAGLDDRIDKGIPAFKAALEANHKDFTIYMYDGVNHAFNNDTSAARYNKAAADLAWSRTIAFLRKSLA
jgi:carboxymethylenebutenolidase